MDSLTTAYLVCMLIGTLGSFAGAYAGNKMSPIESSTLVVEPVASVQTPPEQPPSPQNTEQTQPVAPSTTA